MTQERTAAPSTCTVHAPHCAMPQPYFVPVRPTCSRITHSNGVVGSTSTLCDCPLMVRATIFEPPCSPVGESSSPTRARRVFCWRGFSQARVGGETSGSDASRTSQFRERERMSQDRTNQDWISLQMKMPAVVEATQRE